MPYSISSTSSDLGSPKSGVTAPRNRPLGETTGTFLRPPQHLTEPFVAFDLRAEADVLLEEARYLPDRRSAKTLVKLPHLRITLTAACAGTSTNRHRTHAPVSVQCLSGLVLVRAGNAEVELDQAGIATIEAEVDHEIKAVTDAAFLISLAWTTEAKEQSEAGQPARRTPSVRAAQSESRLARAAPGRRVGDQRDRPKVSGFPGSYF